jgi:predicted MFS family arabinose efflux permease
MMSPSTAPVGVSQASMAKISKRAWLVLGMLIFVYVLNFLCRTLPAVLAKPIQDSLQITDGQYGLITGFYFAIFYTFISIPIGYLADKTSRSKVLAAACAIWSAATMTCGLAVNFMQFAFSYMAVGFGEAGGVPPSYALISDYFPPGKRGTALGLYNLGIPIGAALAIAFGASIASAFSWQMAFKCLGAIGLIAVLGIIFIVKEPRRGGLDPASAQPAKKSGFWETLVTFFSRRSLLLAAIGGGATQMITYGVGNFAILFLMREKGMTLGQVALWYALMVVVVMSAGLFVSGRSVDLLTRRSKRAYGLVGAVSLTISLPFYVAFVSAQTWPLALVFLSACMFLNFFYLPAVVTFVQQEVRPDQRVMSGALLLLVTNFIGLGLGPTFVGAVSDYFRAAYPHNSLQFALYALLPCYVMAIVLFFWLSRVLQRESRKAGETAA